MEKVYHDTNFHLIKLELDRGIFEADENSSIDIEDRYIYNISSDIKY